MEIFISFKSFGQTTLYSLDLTGNVYNVIILNKNYFLKCDKDLKVKREVRWSKADRQPLVLPWAWDTASSVIPRGGAGLQCGHRHPDNRGMGTCAISGGSAPLLFLSPACPHSTELAGSAQ